MKWVLRSIGRTPKGINPSQGGAGGRRTRGCSLGSRTSLHLPTCWSPQFTQAEGTAQSQDPSNTSFVVPAAATKGQRKC